MKKPPIQKVLQSLNSLSAEDVLALERAVKTRKRELDSVIALQQRTESIKACPHCGSFEIKKHGLKDGRQRFKCKEALCGKTFNVLTATPFAHLHHVEKHIANAKCMMNGLTVRKTAEVLEVHRNTAFRWRHRFLTEIETLQPDVLSGIVEADETYFLESHKGQRGGSKAIGRKPKKRGTPAKQRGLSREQIPVLVARDRTTGRTLSVRIKNSSATELGRVIRPVLAKDVELITDSSTAFQAMANKNQISYRAVPRNPKHKTKGVLHINNVNAYDMRLKKWMERFYGVSTKYLPNYLGWHRWMDGQKKVKPSEFWKAAVG